MLPLVLLCGFILIQCVAADILVLPFDGRYILEEFRDMPSNFGAGLSFDGLHGMVVYAEPADACISLKKPPVDDNPTKKWIILIARYNCSFETKVRMAQQYGYSAAIIHNVRSDSLEPMSAKNATGIRIPSVFVGENTGIILKEAYSNRDYFVIINSEMPFNINTHLLLPFAIVVGICFLVMVIFMIAKCIRDRRMQRRERLSSSALGKIPTSKFQKGDPRYETCAICLDDYVEGENLRVLPCAHAYHSKCIDPWLTKNSRVCPVCKRKVFAHTETRYSTDSDSDSSSSDSDDTTPLLNAGSRTTSGGTFVPSVIRSISQINAGSFITASDQHSINGEQQDEAERYEDCCSTDSTTDEVETRPRPGTSNSPRDNIV